MDSSFEETTSAGSPNSPVSRAFAEFWDQVMLSQGLRNWTIAYKEPGPLSEESTEDGQVPRNSPQESTAASSSGSPEAQLPDADVVGFASSSFDEAFAEIEQDMQKEMEVVENDAAALTAEIADDELDNGDHRSPTGFKRSHEEATDHEDLESNKHFRGGDVDADANDDDDSDADGSEDSEIQETHDAEEEQQASNAMYARSKKPEIVTLHYNDNEDDEDD